MSNSERTPENQTMLQGFEWNVPADGKHYQRLRNQVGALKSVGVTNIWLPPGCKAGNPQGNGYDIYDLYDLGEFEQKGSRGTKWGSKEDLLELSKVAKEHGVGLYWDAVLEHKAAADRKERVKVVEVDTNNRKTVISGTKEIDAWLGFDFPGRGDRYSSQKYHWYHFTGTDYDAQSRRKAIFKIQGKTQGRASGAEDEQGEADFLMFSGLDYHHEEVSSDVKHWGKWIVKEVGLSGFRLDAVQHFSKRFTYEWMGEVRKECGEQFFVGEFWSGNLRELCSWVRSMDFEMSLFDCPLLNSFSSLSKSRKGDLRTVFNDTLVKAMPLNAVTVVQNHDTQKGQTVETTVESFFKPLAYALILLRDKGYPCLFYGDLYGIQGKHAEPPSCNDKLADMTLVRRLYAYGEQEDYWTGPSCVGFVRRGTRDRSAGLACIMSNADSDELQMGVGTQHKNEVWTDILGWQKDEVKIDEDGNGLFKCPRRGVSIWVYKHAQGRDRFPVGFDSNIYL